MTTDLTRTTRTGPIIFLGPSLAHAAAVEILPDAIYLPPVKQGDLLSALTRYEPDTVGIIDGEFSQTLSVWHKEILHALSIGVRVLGASSMGALRAVETDTFGMIGVGTVYTMFANGMLTDDDEVALSHATAEDGYRPLSDALVNIRATLAGARDADVITTALHDTLIAAAKVAFFPHRSFAALIAHARHIGVAEAICVALKEYVSAHRRDLKAEDARQLLQLLATGDPVLCAPAPFTFERTGLFQALYDQDRRVTCDGVDVPLSAIAAEVALHEPEFDTINGHALDRALLSVLAELLQMEPTSDDIESERRRFALARRLKGPDAMDTWRQRHHLSAMEFEQLMRGLAARRKMHRWLLRRRGHPRTARLVLDELRVNGSYVHWANAAARTEGLLSDHPDPESRSQPAPDQVALSLEHMRVTGWRPTASLDTWIEEAGFSNALHFRLALLRSRSARARMAAAVNGIDMLDADASKAHT